MKKMLEQQEKLWDFDAVVPGQAGGATVVEITAQNIAEYARLSQNADPRYQEGRDGAMAMPTMILSYAPLLRERIAEANGFVALEQSTTARRQTPFAKCEIRWRHPVSAGDTITASRRVLEKYERRGSKFVTFRVESLNQDGVTVGEYDYTCIFEYAKGQREVPEPSATARTLETPAVNAAPASHILGFEDVAEGLLLPSLPVTESQETINAKSEFRLDGSVSASNIHTDEEFARQNIFGGTVNSGPATMSYVDQTLELAFPLEAFYNGGSLLMRAITPFRSGDTVTFQGEVSTKRQEGSHGVVECRVKGTNQRGELVCLADASMVFA
jgi:acyl dehydratase